MADDGSNGNGGNDGNGGESGNYGSGSDLGFGGNSGQGGYDGFGSSGSSGENIDPGILVSPDFGGWKPEDSDWTPRNWDMSKGYMNYSTARLNQWVWGQMVAAGLGPDPVSKAEGNYDQPANQEKAQETVTISPALLNKWDQEKNADFFNQQAASDKSLAPQPQMSEQGTMAAANTVSPGNLNRMDQEMNKDWWSQQNTNAPEDNSIVISAAPQQIVKPWKEFDSDVASGNTYYFKQDGKFYAKQGDTLFQGTDGVNGDVILTPIPDDDAKAIIWEYVTKNGTAFTYEGQDYIFGYNYRVYKLMREDSSGLYYYAELPRDEGIKINYDYSQQKFEQGPPGPGLEDTFNPAEPWGNLLTRGPIQKRLLGVASNFVTGMLKPYINEEVDKAFRHFRNK